MTQDISHTFFSSNLDSKTLMVEMKQRRIFPQEFLEKKATRRCQNYTVSTSSSSQNENCDAPVLLR